MDIQRRFLREAIGLAYSNVAKGGRPFGAVIARQGEVIAIGVNTITATLDPTAHAEMNALREASRVLQTPDLTGCEVYASGQPCPMCMAAMRMAGITSVTYAYSNEDAAPFGLSTNALYAELAKPFVDQSMAINHVPERFDTHPDLYAEWIRREARRTQMVQVAQV